VLHTWSPPSYPTPPPHPPHLLHSSPPLLPSCLCPALPQCVLLCAAPLTHTCSQLTALATLTHSTTSLQSAVSVVVSHLSCQHPGQGRTVLLFLSVSPVRVCGGGWRVLQQCGAAYSLYHLSLTPAVVWGVWRSTLCPLCSSPAAGGRGVVVWSSVVCLLTSTLCTTLVSTVPPPPTPCNYCTAPVWPCAPLPATLLL